MDDAGPFDRLPVPRQLTGSELDVARVLAARLDAAVVDQLDAAVVVGTCRCGCGSVELATAAPPLPTSWTVPGSTGGRPLHLAASTTGTRPGCPRVSVTLHLFRGRVGELELFDAERGEGHAVEAADLVLDPDVEVC